MQIQITLYGNETPEQLARVHKMLGTYRGISDKSSSMDLEIRVDSSAAILELERLKAAADGLKLPESVGEKLAVELVRRDDETLAKLEAVNPQFGKQPLPEGAVGPLAHPSPPSAPSPAVAAPSMIAPAAPTAIAPAPPNVAPPAPPAPPAAATQAPAGDVKLDKHGLPWDERIHASSRALIADGSWRQKRGVDPAKVTEVEAQLRGQMGPAPKADPLDNLKPEPAAPPPPAAAGEQRTFGSIARRVGEAVAAGRITQDHVSATLAGMGYPDGLYQALPHPERWDLILETLGA